MVVIRNKNTGDILFSIEAESLYGADLRDTELSEADLSQTDLRHANLAQADLYQILPEINLMILYQLDIKLNLK